MRHLVCPQCGVRRFYVKNQNGESIIVQVSRDLTVVALNEDDSLNGFDLKVLYCLGCSWSGSPASLKKYFV